MPTVYNGSIKLHYQLAGNPAGVPLLLHHGLGQNLYSWHMGGYVSGLGDRFRLVLLDARGHGKSDKPQDVAAYRFEERVGDVLAVLDHAQIPQSHLLGYSMGGRVGFALAQIAPERLQTLVIGGAHPDPEGLQAFRGVDGQEPDAFMAAFEALIGESLTPLARQFILANDLQALAASAQPQPALTADWTALQTPILLFAGTSDRRCPQIQALAQQLPQAQFVALPGLNHVEAIAQSAVLLPHVRAFLTKNLWQS